MGQFTAVKQTYTLKNLSDEQLASHFEKHGRAEGRRSNSLVVGKDFAAAHIQHMQKALTFMNLQLHHVVQNITGVTGMKIIRAIVAGQRDSQVLAEFRDVRCKSSVETIRAALVGNYQP